jgi:hypothetical protein
MSSIFNIDKTCAAYELGFGLLHLAFPKVLGWSEELPKLSKDNAGVMQILNLCLTFKFFWSANAFWTCPEDLKRTKLGKSVKLGHAIFWGLRFIQQFIYLDVKQPVDQVFTLIFGSGILLHGLNYKRSLTNA